MIPLAIRLHSFFVSRWDGKNHGLFGQVGDQTTAAFCKQRRSGNKTNDQVGMPGIDVDPACRHPFEANHGARFIEEDVSKVKGSALTSIFGDADIRILAGCAPCQPFSTYTRRYNDRTNLRWSLLHEFRRLIEEVVPDVVTMENVPAIEKHAVWEAFLATLEKFGYAVWHEVVDCSGHGLPQKRNRKVPLASRIGPIERISYPRISMLS
jgi:DNA (cytosine-5)-methyltransferase 1